MLIDPMLQRLQAARDLHGILEVALVDSVALHGAERGTIQLLNTSGQLVIVHQHGLSKAFLETFRIVGMDDSTICAQALSQQGSVFVADIEQYEGFAPFLSLARGVPFRSVLSTPLIAPEQGCIGMLSVLFASRSNLTRLELDTMNDYCREVTRSLVGLGSVGSLRLLAEQAAENLLHEAH